MLLSELLYHSIYDGVGNWPVNPERKEFGLPPPAANSPENWQRHQPIFLHQMTKIDAFKFSHSEDR